MRGVCGVRRSFDCRSSLDIEAGLATCGLGSVRHVIDCMVTAW